MKIYLLFFFYYNIMSSNVETTKKKETKNDKVIVVEEIKKNEEVDDRVHPRDYNGINVLEAKDIVKKDDSIFGEVITKRDEQNQSSIKVDKRNEQSTKRDVRLNYKEELFCQKYVEFGFNAMKAYLAIRPRVKPTSASDAGSKLLKLGHIKMRITKIIGQSELDELEVIARALKSKTPTQISWKALHSYIRTSLELKGKLNKDKKSTSVKIGLVITR